MPIGPAAVNTLGRGLRPPAVGLRPNWPAVRLARFSQAARYRGWPGVDRSGRASSATAEMAWGIELDQDGTGVMVQEPGDGIRQYKAAMERIRSGESGLEEVELPSGRVLLTPDPTTPNGVKIEVLDSDRTTGSRHLRDPAMLEAMERIKDLIGHFRNGELDAVEIPLPSGETLQLTRDGGSPGAFTARSSEGGPGMVSIPFGPSPTPPDGYPEDLPFLAELPVGFTEMEGQGLRTLTWFVVHDSEESLENLRLQLNRDGWEEKDESTASTAFGRTTLIEFRMGEKRRTVMLTRFGEHTQLKLIDHPSEE